MGCILINEYRLCVQLATDMGVKLAKHDHGWINNSEIISPAMIKLQNVQLPQ